MSRGMYTAHETISPFHPGPPGRYDMSHQRNPPQHVDRQSMLDLCVHFVCLCVHIVLLCVHTISSMHYVTCTRVCVCECIC